jgi:hypothetical protein
MPERHPLPNLEQLDLLRCLLSFRSYAEALTRTPQQQWISNWLRSCDEEQAARVVGERVKPPDEALLDPSC